MTDAATAKKAPAKAPMPSPKFETEFTPGSAKSAATDAGAKKAEMLMISPDQIEVIDGFNVRIETPDYKEHVANVKNSIIANGFYSNKPLAVYVLKTEDGKSRFGLIDGHTRLRAVKDAIFEGAAIEAIPVVVKPQTNTAEDLMVALVQDNEGRPLNPYERAIVVKRLEGYGWDDKTIAEKLGVTDRYVADLKVLAGAPAKVRDLVLRGKVAATEAVKQLRKDAGKAAAVLDAAVKDAEAKGKSKATAKNVKAAKGEKPAKKAKASAKPQNGVTVSVEDNGDRRTTTYRYVYAQGAIVDTAEIKPVWALNESAWWDYVDEKQDRDHVVINDNVEITISFESAVPAEDDAGDGDEGSVDHAAGGGEGDDNGGL